MSISTETLRRYVHPGFAFVETGTDGGGGVAAALECGAVRALTCEIDSVKYEAARLRFLGDHRVSVAQARSENGWLGRATVDAARVGPVVFWLDAHDEHATPILEELEQIRCTGIIPGCILMDDMRYVWSGYWGVSFDNVLRACRGIGRCKLSLIDGCATGQIAHGAPDILVAEYAP